jgi:hypothetical protein
MPGRDFVFGRGAGCWFSMFGYGSRAPSELRIFALLTSAPVFGPEDNMSEKIEKSLLDIDFAA